MKKNKSRTKWLTRQFFLISLSQGEPIIRRALFCRARLARLGLICVVIPTLDAGERLPLCLNALIASAVDGLVTEVVVADGGSSDGTLAIADAAGARIVPAERGRGVQLCAGAAQVKAPWILFLHSDTVLEESWLREAADFVNAGDDRKVGVFTLDFDRDAMAAKIVAWGAMVRTRMFNSPYGDQGLLISRALYEEIGGFREMVLFEDVDIVARIRKTVGAGAFQILRARAITSAARYERDGYARRVLSNALLRLRYRMGANPEKLASEYR